MKSIKKIFISIFIISFGLCLISCNNILKDDSAAKVEAGSAAVRFTISSPDYRHARMVTPAESEVTKKLDSLSYLVTFYYSSNGTNFEQKNPAFSHPGIDASEEVIRFYSLDSFLEIISSASFTLGSWKMTISGVEGQNGSEIVHATSVFVVGRENNQVKIKFEFSSVMTGSLKYYVIENNDPQLNIYFALYKGNSVDESKAISLTGDNETNESIDSGSMGNYIPRQILSVGNLEPGEYYLKITEYYNGEESYNYEHVYIYGGLESTGYYYNKYVYATLTYDSSDESLVHLYDKALDSNLASFPKIRKFSNGRITFYADDNQGNPHKVIPYKAGSMFTGWYADSNTEYVSGINEPVVQPFIPYFEPRDRDGYYVKRNYDLYAGWTPASYVISPAEVYNKFYVQMAKDDQTVSNGYIIAKSLNELPALFEPYDTSMGQVKTDDGYTEVSSAGDYVIINDDNNEYLYFFKNKNYTSDNLKLRWNNQIRAGVDLGTTNWEDDVNQKDLAYLFVDIDDFVDENNEAYDKQIFEKIYKKGNNLYILGKTYKSDNANAPYYFCMVKCELNETTHTPDIESFEMCWKEIDDTIYKIQSFAVSDSNLVVAYKEDIDSTDVKIASYELNEFGNIVGEPVIKSLSDLYTITSSGSSFQTTAEITEIYYYDGYFYTFVNECNVVSGGEADSGNTLVSTGKVLKLNSNLIAASNYSAVPEIKRLDAADNVYMKFKGASTPADMKFFMGPDRILGTLDNGSMLILADDGFYMYKDSNEYKAKWASRIVVFDIESGSIVYYIPVNLPYRGGQKVNLNSVEHFAYEQ